eukprot:3940380-Rhodomonas_salina.2
MAATLTLVAITPQTRASTPSEGGSVKGEGEKKKKKKKKEEEVDEKVPHPTLLRTSGSEITYHATDLVPPALLWCTHSAYCAT